MKALLRPVLYSIFPALEQIQLLHLYLQAAHRRRRSFILSYQMGKVGSSTVSDSLQATQRSRLLLHLHLLSRDRLEAEPPVYRAAFPQSRRMNGLHLLLLRLEDLERCAAPACGTS